jgi:capsular exopolysaccharide synthesis family protein
MIWVQAPPTIVNGEVITQSVSIAKHQNLISSQLVLSNAIKKGKFESLATFQQTPAVAGTLKGMLKVYPSDKNSDSLDLVLTGMVGSDLPHILDEIVASYKSILEEDTKTTGQESVVLIEQLQKRLEEAQVLDQSKYFELLKKLNLTSENEAGKWLNPYINDIVRLKAERDLLAKDLNELDQKIRTLKQAFEKNDTPLTQRLQRLMMFEAKKALQYSDGRNEDPLDLLTPDERSTFSRLQARLDSLDAKVFDLETQQEEALRQYGPRHPASTSVESMLSAYKNKQSEVSNELERLKKVFEGKQEEAIKNESQNQDSKRKDSDLVVLYGMKLTSDQATQKKQLEKVVAELSKLEESSKVIASDMAEVNMLKSQINERRDSVAKILDKLSAINVLSNNYTVTKVKVIDSASGARQVAPKMQTYLAIATLIAVAIGVLLAILIDRSDLAYRTPIDIQHSLSVPVICKIPKIRTLKALPGQTGSPILVTAFNPQSPASETFRAARTALLFSANQSNSKVFLFTSPSPGDGKSTTAANIAVSLAQSGKRVALFDADFRRPRVQQNFGIQIEPGATDVISGGISLMEAVRVCDFQERLTLLTTGGRPSDAGELVASPGFASIVEQLREQFDIVIIDSPPILPVADSTSLATVVDGIFLVLRIRKGVMLAAHKAKERLDMVQGKVMGVIVNGMDENVYYSEYGMYYRGAYYSGYGRYYDSQNSSYFERSVKESQNAKTNTAKV